jgi:hypothetical protein
LIFDGVRVEPDNNIVERSIRPLALTLKNAHFAGCADQRSVIASLVENCKLNGIDSHAYLADVINRQRPPKRTPPPWATLHDVSEVAGSSVL